MRSLSLCLTVALLGGAPLAALAMDYGPGAPLLAAETNAPTLPGAAVRGEAVHGESASAEPAATPEEEDPVRATLAPRVAPSAGGPHAGSTTATATRPRVAAPASTGTPATASWQSLLPGSIQ